MIIGHKGTITYNIGEKYRGQGIVSEAVKLLTNYAFKKYKLVRIDANLRSYNIASKRVLEKNGFELEGIKRKNTKKNKRYYDDLIYSKII